jgi:type IX secretion system PorP/SprF family membrane protein
MKRISLIVSVLVSVLSGITTFAQQDVMFTQYMFNGLTINPAYAGSHDAISTNFIWRKQWLNLDGAPQSTNFSIHSPIGGDRIGLGLQLVQDKIGVSKEFIGNLSASYMMPISSTAKLAFGLSGGLDNMDFNFADLYTANDPNFDPANNIKANKINFGTGLYFFSKKTYIGLSVPRILENDFASATSNSVYTQKRHAFVYAGHVFELSPNVKFKPNVLVKMTTNSPVSVDLSANFLFIDKIWLGASYRQLESLDLLAQYYITDQLSVGYAYDMTTKGVKDISKSSHEIMLNYLFSFRKKAMLSPRYF